MLGRRAEISRMPMSSDDEIAMRHVLPILVLPILASCLELEQTIVIRADGSGTQKMTLGLTNRALRTLENSLYAANPMGGVDPLAIFEEEFVASELNAQGLKLRSHKTWTERRRRFVEVEADFANIAGLQKSPLAGSKAEWVVLPGEGKWQGKMRLIFYPQGRRAWQDAKVKIEELSRDPMVQSHFKRQLAEVEGLDIALHIEVPGEIVWLHNLKKDGPRTVTARVTEKGIERPQDLIALLAPRYEVIFDARDCTWQ